MAIRFTCSNSGCGKTLRVKDELAGKRIKCPECGIGQAVPATDDEPDVEEPAAAAPSESKGRGLFGWFFGKSNKPETAPEDADEPEGPPLKPQKVTCPDCNAAFTIVPDDAGAKKVCKCGRDVYVPNKLWHHSDNGDRVHENFRGFDVSAKRLEKFNEVLVFQIEMLPKTPMKQADIGPYYQGTFHSADLAVNALVQHILDRARPILESRKFNHGGKTYENIRRILVYSSTTNPGNPHDPERVNLQVSLLNGFYAYYSIHRVGDEDYVIANATWADDVAIKRDQRAIDYGKEKPKKQEPVAPPQVVEMQAVRKCSACGYVETCDVHIKADLAKSGDAEGKAPPGAAIECCKCARNSTKMLWRTKDGKFFEKAVKV